MIFKNMGFADWWVIGFAVTGIVGMVTARYETDRKQLREPFIIMLLFFVWPLYMLAVLFEDRGRFR